jgi:hypothetical protein
MMYGFAISLYNTARWIISSNGGGGMGNHLVTEDGAHRITEDNKHLITE